MKAKYESSPREVERMNTLELRENFLVEDVFINDSCVMTYTHYDRMILGGILPVFKSLTLHTYPELKSEYFLKGAKWASSTLVAPAPSPPMCKNLKYRDWAVYTWAKARKK